MLIVGPVPGKKYSEMTFPILAPDPAKSKDVNYLTIPNLPWWKPWTWTSISRWYKE